MYSKRQELINHWLLYEPLRIPRAVDVNIQCGLPEYSSASDQWGIRYISKWRLPPVGLGSFSPYIIQIFHNTYRHYEHIDTLICFIVAKVMTSLHECHFSSADTFLTVTLKWARWRLKSPASPLFTQPFNQAQIKENIKAPRHWPLCGDFTGDPWSPRTNGQ